MNQFIELAKTEDGVVVLCESESASRQFFEMLDVDLCGMEEAARRTMLEFYHSRYGNKVCYRIRNLKLSSVGPRGYDFSWCDLTYYSKAPMKIIAFSDINRNQDFGEIESSDCTIADLLGFGVMPA